MSFDLLGQLFGKDRRRRLEERLEQQERQDAQTLLDAGKARLVSFALQALSGIPDDTSPAALHLTAQALLSSVLTAPASLSLPALARTALWTAMQQALSGVPLPDPNLSDPNQAGAASAFQVAAKVAVAQAIRALTL